MRSEHMTDVFRALPPSRVPFLCGDLDLDFVKRCHVVQLKLLDDGKNYGHQGESHKYAMYHTAKIGVCGDVHARVQFDLLPWRTNPSSC